MRRKNEADGMQRFRVKKGPDGGFHRLPFTDGPSSARNARDLLSLADKSGLSRGIADVSVSEKNMCLIGTQVPESFRRLGSRSDWHSACDGVLHGMLNAVSHGFPAANSGSCPVLPLGFLECINFAPSDRGEFLQTSCRGPGNSNDGADALFRLLSLPL